MTKTSKPPALTKAVITELFDQMREVLRNAPHRVPSFKEIDAEYEPILAKMELELAEEARYLKEHGRFPGVEWKRGLQTSKESAIGVGKEAPGGAKLERSGKKRPTPAGKLDRRS